MNALKKIRVRAKQIMKRHPSKKWKSAIIEAGRDYRAGKLKSRSTPKKKKRTTRRKTARRVSSKKVSTIIIYKPRKRKVMARSKKHYRRKHRRVGAAAALSPASPLVKFGSIAAGWFLLGKPINSALDTATAGKIPGKLVGVGEAGIGYLIMNKGKRSLVKSVLGGALIGAGLRKLATEFGVVSGYGSVPVVGNRVNGYGMVPIVGGPAGYAQKGYTPSTLLAGALNGYVPNLPSNVIGGLEDGTGGSGSGINSDSR